jgi:hypothetical protein
MNFMKTKMLLTAALIGAASLSANAGVFFGFSVGLPLPVVVAPPAVVVGPACPAPGYVWAPGYWSVSGRSRCWVAGGWHYRPGYGGYGHPYGWHR